MRMLRHQASLTRNCIRRIPKHSFRRATSPVRQVPSDLGFKHSFMRGTGPIRQVLSDIGFKHSFMRTTNTRRLCRAEKPAQGRERSLALLGRRTSLLSSRFRQTFRRWCQVCLSLWCTSASPGISWALLIISRILASSCWAPSPPIRSTSGRTSTAT